MWSSFPPIKEIEQKKKQKDREARLALLGNKKPKTTPLVQIVKHGTPEAINIDKGSSVWIKKYCVFSESNTDFCVNRYREWFYNAVDNEVSMVAIAMNAFEKIIIDKGTVLLACDQYDRGNHGQIIKEYLEWSVPRIKKKLAETDKPVDNWPFKD